MKRKVLSVILSLSLAAAALAGCGAATTTPGGGGGQAVETADTPQKEAPAAASEEAAATDVNEDGTVNNPENVKVEEGKLVFWSLFSGGDGGFMDKIIADYNATEPAMGVQSIMLVWGDYYTKLQTAVAAGKGPDIGISHASKLPELIDQGVVIPLDEYLTAEGVDMNTLFSKNSVDSVTADGAVYGIPLDTHAEIMYYNKDILEQAGVTLNTDGQLDIKSWDDFKAMLDKVKAVLPEGSTPISLTNAGDDPYRIWWATYYQMGGTALVNDEGTEVTMDEAIAVKAAQFVKDLYDEGYVMPGIDDHGAIFQEGKGAFYLGGTWSTGALEGIDGLNFGAQSFPQLFETNACWADSHVLVIPFNKDRTEEETKAAVAFILAASTNGGATWAQSGQIPSAVAVLESEEYLSLNYRSDYKSALTTAVLPTKNPNFYAMKAGMIESLNALWVGNTDAAAAVANLKSELESNLQ